MAKRKGKNSKQKGNSIGQPNAKIKKVEIPQKSQTKTKTPALACLTYPDEATTSYPESSNDEDTSQVKENDGEKTKCISGFIFMCNPSTKLECYQYRVFGLPSWQKEVVEKIKPGTELFLYDFGLKLLYGAYMATSAGNLNLEPAAFSGKYPAQVKFKIFKECLPLPESSLRHIIRENYTGSKFNQELSKKQVKKLLSSFRPLFGSSDIPLANVSLPRAMPPSGIQNQFKHRTMMEVPYMPEIQYNQARPVVDFQRVPMLNNLHQGYYRPPPPCVEIVYPTVDHQSLPSTSGYQIASSQRPSFPTGANHAFQEQPHLRYRPTDGRTPLAQATSLERYTTHDEAQRQYVHQVPLQRGREGDVVYQVNPMQTLVVPAPPHHHQLSSQHYNNSTTADSPSTAAHAPYISGPVSQAYVPEYAAYNYSDATAAAQYPSASVSQPYVPESYAYSDPAAAQYHSAPATQHYVPAYTYPEAAVSQPYVPEYVPAPVTVTTQWPQAGVAPHTPTTSYYSYSH